MTDDERLVHLQDLKSFIDSEIRRLKEKRRNSERPKGNHNRLAYSGLFVQTSCLVPFIEAYMAEDNKIEPLARRANVSDATIRGILKGKSTWTREEVAESIMMALDLPHEFNNFALVRVKRKYMAQTEPPFSHFEEV